MLEYKLDISRNSYSHIHTPDISGRIFPFYLTECGYFEAGSQYFTRRDGKEAALLIYTTGGQGELEWKSQRAILKPGSAIVIYCDTFHVYRTLEAPWKFHWAHFDGSGLEGYRAALFDRPAPVTLNAPAEMRENFSRLEALSNGADILSAAEIGHNISAMMLMLLRARVKPGAGAASFHRDEVEKLAAYIRQNFEKPLSMDDFVEHTNISKYHLIHIFKRQMGMPPYKYMHNCRINRAQLLLRTTRLSIAEVGARVGYPDTVNFIRHFRAIAGGTPAGYRRESIQLP